MCIQRQLAGGKSVAVALALVACDRWHMTHDTWHLILKKSIIRDTKRLSTDADSSTDTKNPARNAKFAKKIN